VQKHLILSIPQCQFYCVLSSPKKVDPLGVPHCTVAFDSAGGGGPHHRIRSRREVLLHRIDPTGGGALRRIRSLEGAGAHRNIESHRRGGQKWRISIEYHGEFEIIFEGLWVWITGLGTCFGEKTKWGKSRITASLKSNKQVSVLMRKPLFLTLSMDIFWKTFPALWPIRRQLVDCLICGWPKHIRYIFVNISPRKKIRKIRNISQKFFQIAFEMYLI
jgi:hypothetical protein